MSKVPYYRDTRKRLIRSYALCGFVFSFISAAMLSGRVGGYVNEYLMLNAVIHVFFLWIVFFGKRAWWHLVMEMSSGLATFIAVGLITKNLISEGMILFNSPFWTWIIVISSQLLGGVMHVFLTDRKAWKLDLHMNLKRKIDVERGSFDYAFPWHFRNAATVADKARAQSMIGVFSGMGVLIAGVIAGSNVMWLIVCAAMFISGLMIWSRVYFIYKLVQLGRMHGKPLLLSIYR